MPQAIVIEAGEQPVVKDVSDLNAEVGGWIEAKMLPVEEKSMIYMDEEGRMKGLPINEVATQLCQEHGLIGNDTVIVGTVVIMGVDGYGENSDVSETLVEQIVEI